MSQWMAELVDAAGLGVGLADGEVDGAADLLVEEDLAGAVGDAEVGADAELAEAAGALVGVEHLDQEVLAALGGRVDDLAALEAEADAGDLAAGVGRRQVEGDLALGRVLDRAGEELAVGHVVLAVGGLEVAAGDVQLQVGAGPLDVDLLAALDPLGEPDRSPRRPAPRRRPGRAGRRGRRGSRSPRTRAGSSPPRPRRRWSGTASRSSAGRRRRSAPSSSACSGCIAFWRRVCCSGGTLRELADVGVGEDPRSARRPPRTPTAGAGETQSICSSLASSKNADCVPSSERSRTGLAPTRSVSS